jgi:predicted PurR-regulated permease PerM
MTLQAQTIFWCLALVAFFILFWIFGSALTPFITGFILAYILHPLVDKIEEKFKLSRMLATVIVTLSSLLLLVLFCLLFVPIFVDQITALVNNVPKYLKHFNEFLSNRLGEDWQQTIDFSTENIANHLKGAADSAIGFTGKFVSKLLLTLIGVIKIVTFMIIAPVVAFYMLIDWHQMIAKINSWLPLQYAEKIRTIIYEIDDIQAAFIRGQSLVILVQAAFYIIALSIAGLDYAFVIGLVTGVLTFIPYVGAGLGFVLSFMVAVAQYGFDPVSLGIIATIFAIGQLLEGYVWVPKLVGESVNMHPVWIMFALVAFGNLYGFAGMLIAVPLAAALGVLAKYALLRYTQSTYYRGKKNVLN